MHSLALKDSPGAADADIAAVLANRFGDGLVYLPRHVPASLYELARQRGFIDSEGYLTRNGRALLARFDFL